MILLLQLNCELLPSLSNTCELKSRCHNNEMLISFVEFTGMIFFVLQAFNAVGLRKQSKWNDHSKRLFDCRLTSTVDQKMYDYIYQMHDYQSNRLPGKRSIINFDARHACVTI